MSGDPMPSLAVKTVAFTRRFLRARKGATAVEFAIISVPLMLFMFGIFELAMILLVTSTLDTATDFAARNIRTGEFRSSGAITAADFRGLVCRNMSWLKDTCAAGNMSVDAESFSTFAKVAAKAEPDPNLPPQPCWEVGNPGDIILVKTKFTWPILNPMLRPLFEDKQGSGSVALGSVRLFRNEPYNPNLTPVGDKCS